MGRYLSYSDGMGRCYCAECGAEESAYGKELDLKDYSDDPFLVCYSCKFDIDVEPENDLDD